VTLLYNVEMKYTYMLTYLPEARDK